MDLLDKYTILCVLGGVLFSIAFISAVFEFWIVCVCCMVLSVVIGFVVIPFEKRIRCGDFD